MVAGATEFSVVHQNHSEGRGLEGSRPSTTSSTKAAKDGRRIFFVEGENALVDIPGAEQIVSKMPDAPAGYEIARVDVVVRLRRKGLTSFGFARRRGTGGTTTGRLRVREALGQTCGPRWWSRAARSR